MNIHCIGNSHLHTFSNTGGYVNFNYSNSNIFKYFYLGPVIAYNFYEHHFPRIKEEYLKNINKETDYIIFVVGEVDCRLHIPLQADKQNKSDEEIIKECVSRFERIYNELSDYKFIIFSTHPTTLEDHDMSRSDRPIYGNVKRRNNICKLWNYYNEQLAIKKKYPYLSIYEDLVDSENMTKMEYFFDYCHLNSEKVWDFIKREFKKINIEV